MAKKSKKAAAVVVEFVIGTISGSGGSRSEVRKQDVSAPLVVPRAGRAPARVKLLVRNAAATDDSADKIKRMYPSGAEVEIRCVGRSSEDEDVVANCVADARILSYFGIGAGLVGLNLDALFAKGKELFVSGFYEAAVEVYTRCVDVCGKGNDRLLIAYSNIAEAWIRLGFYEKALDYSEKALIVDPGHAKSLLRKGKALHGMQEYTQACKCLHLAKKSVSSSKEIAAALSKSLIFKEQSENGTHDFSGYLSSGGGDAPECSDYVGPVKMKLTGRNERGLFVTMNVKAGELLLVSNAIAFMDSNNSNNNGSSSSSDYENSDDARLDLIVKTYRACLASPRTLRRVFYTLSDGGIPPMNLFRPNSNWSKTKTAVAGTEAETEKEESMMDILLNVTFEAQSNKNFQPQGFWDLPSFINHSCLPTVSRYTAGRAKLILAAQDMKVGDELVRCYTEPFVHWSRRKELCARHGGFTCGCARCGLEQGLGRFLKEVNGRYDALYRRNRTAQRDIAMAKLAVEIERKLVGLLGYLKEHEKMYLRATYSSVYETYFMKRSEMVLSASGGWGEGWLSCEDEMIMPEAETIMRAMHLTCPGHVETILRIISIAVKSGSFAVEESLSIIAAEFTCCVGKQRPSVIADLISKVLKHGWKILEDIL